MKEFAREDISVDIRGKQYGVRELSLSQKIRLLSDVGEFIRDILNHAFFRKNESGGISLALDDEVSFADMNVDKIILCSIQAAPELLRLAVPDFKDWDNLPESESREALLKVIEVQDFKGFVANFFSAGKNLFR